MLASIDKAIEQNLHLTHEDAQNNRDILINAFDREHTIVFWNKKAEDHFGVNQKDAIGKKLEELAPYTKNNDKMKYLDRALFGRPLHIVREKYLKKAAYYEQWILPVRKNGEVVAALNIVKDIPS